MPMVTRNGSRRAFACLAGSATALAGSAALLPVGTSGASSHREAPLIAADPQVDNTDVYAFVSPDKPDSVTFIANWLPFSEPVGGPTFYQWATDAAYDVNIDNNGDAKPDVIYRWTFTTEVKDKKTFLYNTGPVNSLGDPTLNVVQNYKLEEIKGTETKTLIEKGVAAPSHTGKAGMPNYAALRDEAITDFEGGGQSYVGQADDPFFLDLRVFDLLYGGDLSEVGTDTLDGYNVNTIALQVPISDVVAGDDPVIGTWSTTSRKAMRTINPDGTQTASGEFVQVSRLGMPLVNEVVIPLELKDAFNALKPEQDSTVPAAVERVTDPEVPKLIEKIYGIPAPKTPREDLVAVFLTGVEGLNKPKGEGTPAEMLRLNTSIKPTGKENRLGVLAKDTQGFPNGRRLTDDVIDITLQAAEGAVRTGKLVKELAKGDGVNQNDVEFGTAFPYVALPHTGSDAVNGGSRGRSSSSANRSDVSTAAGTDGTPQGGVSAGAGGTVPVRSSSPVLPISVAAFGVLLGGAGIFLLRRRETAPVSA